MQFLTQKNECTKNIFYKFENIPWQMLCSKSYILKPKIKLVLQNLDKPPWQNSYNSKLAEIWQLVTQSPEEFKGGAIWDVIVNIHGAVKAIGLGLLVLFFVVGVVKTCGSFTEVNAH